jgi:hypothetical protein
MPQTARVPAENEDAPNPREIDGKETVMKIRAAIADVVQYNCDFFSPLPHESGGKCKFESILI